LPRVFIVRCFLQSFHEHISNEYAVNVVSVLGKLLRKCGVSQLNAQANRQVCDLLDLLCKSIKLVKQITDLPVCLGIELRDPALAKQLTKNAHNIDGILVRDVLMETLQKASDNKHPGQLPTEELERAVEDFSTSLVLRR